MITAILTTQLQGRLFAANHFGILLMLIWHRVISLQNNQSNAYRKSARFIGKVCILECFLCEKWRGIRKCMLSFAKMMLTMSKRALNKIFSKKLKFDHEAAVSDNDNMNFWYPRAFLHRKRLMRHTLPINRAGLKLPTLGTRLIVVTWCYQWGVLVGLLFKNTALDEIDTYNHFPSNCY